MPSVVTIIFLWAIVSISNCTNLPSNILKCDKKASTFSDCLAKSSEQVLKRLQKPIPELGLPSFEPFGEPSFVFPATEKHPMEQKFTDIKIWGFTSAQILKFEINLEAKVIFIECLLPIMTADMEFEFNGILFGEKINKVKGNYKFTYRNILNNMTAKIEEYDKDGEKHIRVVGESNIVSSDPPVFDITSDDKVSGEHIMKVFNEHYDDLKVETDYMYDKFWLMMFIDSFNIVSDVVPLSNLF